MNKKEALEFVLEDGRNLSKLNKQFRNDEDVVLKALDSTTPIFHFASQELRANEKIAKKALESCIKNYNAVPMDLKKNKSFTLFALSIDGHVFNEIPKELKSDEDIIAMAVYDSPHALNYISEISLSNESFIHSMLAKNGACFQYLPLDMRKSLDLLNIAIQKGENHKVFPIKYASEEIRSNKDYIFSLIENPELKDSFLLLSYVSDSLKDDANFVFKIAQQSPQNLIYASSRIRHIMGLGNDRMDKLQVLSEQEILNKSILNNNEQNKKKIKI